MIDDPTLELSPLANQVAGHPDGVQTLQGGSLVVKDCLPAELDFYRQVRSATSGPLHELASMMPSFHGSRDEYSGSSQGTSRIVLENLTHGFVHPNVCDIKLGTQLWDQDATEDKRLRMEQAAQSTTSGMCGLRLTGWQVWDDQTRSYHSVPKTFGKTIQAPDLLLGARMLMASPKDGDAERAESILPGSSRVRISPPPPTSEIHGSLVNSESGFYLPHLSPQLTRPLLARIIPAIERLVDILSRLEVRIRGGSILIVYEGHAGTLASRLESAGKDTKGIVDVRFIDFAHAALVEGQGPDQGVLLGLKTTLELLSKVESEL